MNENVVVKTKNSKGIIILVILLLLAVIGLSGYIVYDKVLSKDSDKKEVTKTEEKEEVKDITDTELVKELHSTLITKDNYNGLYFSNKVSISDTNNKKLITFNLKKYKEDNNLEYSKNVKYSENNSELGFLNLSVKKTDFNKYMQNKYNVNYEYNLADINSNNVTESSGLGGCVSLFVDSENYKFVSIGATCGSSYIKNKLIKAEQDNEYIYIYDKAVSCIGDIGVTCNLLSDDWSVENAIIDCTPDETGEFKTCPAENNEEKLAEYAINNLSDKLHTFKHTFKKASDGNYYWVSSEIYK